MNLHKKLSKVRILFLSVLFIGSKLLSQDDIFNIKISLAKSQYKLEELINEIEQSKEADFSYDPGEIPLNQEITFSEKELVLKEVLEIIGNQVDIKYSVYKNYILLKNKKQIAANKTCVLSGTVKDKETGELLIGATIYIPERRIGVVSNNYGFYSISTFPGSYTINVLYLGYKTYEEEIVLKSNTRLDISLEINIAEVEEVKIFFKPTDKNVASTDMNITRLNAFQIKRLPSFLGETDVLRSTQSLPGVDAANDGLANLSIRGGSHDQNLILLDEAPVYNPNHALGFFSSFNNDAIKYIKIYKGNIPANYGGHLSSVIDVRTKEGNRNKFISNGSINTFASRLTVESPILSDKTSFLLSGRYSYTSFLGTIGNALSEVIYLPAFNNYPDETKINFYDFNFKINHQVNNKHHVYLSSYKGEDYLYFPSFDDRCSLRWGNFTSTARWNYNINKKTFLNTSIIVSDYNYKYTFTDNGMSYLWTARMKEFDIKLDFDYYPNPNNHLKFGIAVNNCFFSPGEITPTDTTSFINAFSLEKKYATKPAVYILNDHKINEILAVNYGIRFSPFFTYYKRQDEDLINNKDLNKIYYSVEPRISARYLINDKNSLKVSYTRTKQYLHLITNASVGYPTDIWIPSDKSVKPQSANQISIGYFRNFLDNMFETSLELYYKKMYNVIDFIDNADLFLNEYIETQIRAGKGTAYGSELLINKNSGRLTGWFGYTIAKTERKITGINFNRSYPARNDHRHKISIVFSYKISETLRFASDFLFKSGGTITIPKGFFAYENIVFNYYTERNGYRLPPYHRLDVSLVYKGKRNKARKWKSEWIFGIHNVYNHKNVFSLYFDIEDINNYNDINATKLYIPGIIPFITYNFKF